MARQIEKQMQDQLNLMYANEGRLKREIQDYNNQLSDDLAPHQREELEKLLTAAQVNLSRTEDKIDEINGNVDELKEKEREATEYKWKDVEPLLKQAVEKHHMSYCVESNKFV